MTNVDADGMVRTDIEWWIEGRKGATKPSRLYGLHARERENAEAAIKARARRGDTVIIREI